MKRTLFISGCSVIFRMSAFCLILACVFLPASAAAQTGTHSSSGRCTTCHSDDPFRLHFPNSAHGSLNCVSCHQGITDLKQHMRGNLKPPPVDCGTCHGEIAREYRNNFHYIQEDFRCRDCHRNIHSLKKQGANQKRAVIEKCTACHGNDEYVQSGHAEAVLKGNQDAATCSDCHGLHDTRVYHTSLDKYPAEAREFYNSRCKRCHADEALMKRNNLPAKIVSYYEETYHGKVHGVGYSTLVAGCADCHTTHNILPKKDPRSSIHPANLIDNCGRCHKGFHPRFVEYKAHPNYRDRLNYPSLFWTFVFMSALLMGTFLFFWMHTLLWWRKTYWEKHAREKAGLTPAVCFPEGVGFEQIQRFSPRERVMHVILIISFFTLVLTGFPLKYSHAAWSKILIQLFGGAPMAGYLHRAAALVLMALVAYVAWKSLQYLFPAGQGRKDWIKRLTGPDSLFPSWKDWEDMKGMFLWFFDKGEMPKFERWTYWEKFDFWAVFWGMFAIGGSGLLLWKPEWSSYIVPGWVLNVATLIHSEEALLAALFIFTVHFFNTHFIPDKFPMDRLIFTGSYTLEELNHQRPLHYERLQKEGKLEELKRPHPSIMLKLSAAAFGLGSLLLGFLLTILLFWSLIMY